MATLRTIRLRIKGTKNIKQITRAMEAVSAVKMRKSQGVALTARPYATAALKLLKSVQSGVPEGSAVFSPLLEKRDTKNILLVVVTSDKGLAGSFNANVLKKAEQFIKNTTTSASGHSSKSEHHHPASEDGGTPPQLRRGQEEKKNVTVATVGKKAGDYFTRRGRTPIVALTGYGDYAEISEVQPIFDAVVEAFTSKKADKIYVIYTNFLSAMKQEVVIRKLLPFSEEGLTEMVKGIVPERGKFSEAQPHLNPPLRTGEEVKSSTSPFQGGAGGGSEYIFEPSPKEIFDSILPALLKIQIYHAILEANASEHSSRMVAMRNATDNAGELIKAYTVTLNKARQAAINKELAEITGGSEALAN